jgi:hypothetical protein
MKTYVLPHALAARSMKLCREDSVIIVFNEHEFPKLYTVIGTRRSHSYARIRKHDSATSQKCFVPDT